MKYFDGNFCSSKTSFRTCFPKTINAFLLPRIVWPHRKPYTLLQFKLKYALYHKDYTGQEAVILDVEAMILNNE